MLISCTAMHLRSQRVDLDTTGLLVSCQTGAFSFMPNLRLASIHHLNAPLKAAEILRGLTEVVELPSLEVSKRHIDGVLRDMLW